VPSYPKRELAHVLAGEIWHALAVFFGKFKERQLAGASPVNLVTAALKAVLISLANWGAPITGATNANPAVISLASHGLSTGQRVCIVGALGNTAINGTWGVTVLTTGTFSLYDLDTGAVVVGNGTWTSGGRVIKLDADEFLSDVPVGDRSGGTSGSLTKTTTLGTLNVSDFPIPSVAQATYQGILYFVDTGNPVTSNLVHANFGGTNIPIVVGSGGVTVNVDVDATGGLGTI
jgi:hypothetical protein